MFIGAMWASTTYQPNIAAKLGEREQVKAGRHARRSTSETALLPGGGITGLVCAIALERTAMQIIFGMYQQYDCLPDL